MRTIILAMLFVVFFTVIGVASSSAQCNDPGVIYHKWVALQSDLSTMHKAFVAQSPDMAATASRLLDRWKPIAKQFPTCDAAEDLSEIFGGVVHDAIDCFQLIADGQIGSVGEKAKRLGMIQRAFYETAWPGSSDRLLPAPHRRNWFSSDPTDDQPQPKPWRRLKLESYRGGCQIDLNDPLDDAECSRGLLQMIGRHLAEDRSEVEAQMKKRAVINWPHYFFHLYLDWATAVESTGYNEELRQFAMRTVLAQFDAWARQSQTGETKTPESEAADQLYIGFKAMLLLTYDL